MTFRARRTPLVLAVVAAGIFWAFVSLLLVLAWATAESGAFITAALFLSIFAIWFTVIALQIWRLKAVVSDTALDLTAHGGARVWMTGGLKSAVIPWNEIQGIQMVDLPMQEPNYIVFSSRGDFTINGTQFNDASRLAGEIAARSGRELGAVPEGRGEAVAQVQKSTSGAQTFLKVCGWVAAVMGILMVLAVLGISTGGGDKGDAIKVGGIAIMMFGIAARLIRPK